jgi:outer membrane biosynthesis protein TonB
MRQVLGLLLSAGLHVGLVASALIYFPAATRFAEEINVVPVELVMLADYTNVRAAQREPEPEPEPVEDELPLDTAPEPEAAPDPEPVQPEAEPEAIAPELEPEPVLPEPEPEPVEPEPELQPEPERPGLDLDGLSDLVDRSREQRPQGEQADEARERSGAGTAMTATLQALAAGQIQRCTRSNADAPVNMDLAVTVEVRLERNGQLSEPPRLKNAARIVNSPNPFMRVAGERALRAVIDCAPYDLPPANYAEWRLLEVNVDTQRGR